MRANVEQRATERTYGIGEDQLTETVDWSAFSLRRAWNEAKDSRAPWWAQNSKEAYSSGLRPPEVAERRPVDQAVCVTAGSRNR